jgi:hypothetical protein
VLRSPTRNRFATERTCRTYPQRTATRHELHGQYSHPHQSPPGLPKVWQSGSHEVSPLAGQSQPSALSMYSGLISEQAPSPSGSEPAPEPSGCP